MPVGYNITKDWKGVNLTDNPRAIADNELAWASNSFPYVPGVPGPRKRQGVVDNLYAPGSIPIASIDDGMETGLYEWCDDQGKRRFAVWDPFALQWWLLDGGLRAVGGAVYPPEGPSVVFPRPLGFALRPGSLVYNNELLLFPGHTWAGLLIGSKDIPANGTARFRELGTTWAAFTGAQDARPKFAFGDAYREALVLGGLPPPYESLLAFTQGVDNTGAAQPAYYTLLSLAKWAGFGYGDGDKLIGFKTVPVLGGSVAIEPYGLAFKRRSVWMMQGGVPTTTSNGTLVVTPVMRGEGLVSTHAVCVTPYGVFWCSGRNVWFMAPGATPKPIANKLKGYLSLLPQTDSPAWYLTYSDDVLYLNCPSSRVGYNGEAADTSPISYATTEQWWCDLRNLEEPQWWGPQHVKASHMVALQSQQGPLSVGGVSAYAMNGTQGAQTLFELNESNPYARTQTLIAGKVSRFGGVVTANVGVGHQWRNGDSLTPEPSGADIGNYGVTGVVLFNVSATLIQWLDGLADRAANVANFVLSGTTDYGNDLYDVGTSAGENGNPTTHQLIRTKVFDFGDPMLQKILECIEVNSAWSPSLMVGAGGLTPWYINPLADGGAESATQHNELQTARGLEAPGFSTTEVLPLQSGFALDRNTLDNDSIPGGSVPMFERFITTPVYPLNSTRFLFRTVQIEMYSALDAPGVTGGFFAPTLPRDYIRRRFSLQSLGFRVRPIGRRPGGTVK